MTTHCPCLIKICWASTAGELKSSIPNPFVTQGQALASLGWEMASSEAAFLYAFSASGICDSGQGICLLTVSFPSFAEGKHSVHWFLWLSWLVPLAPVQRLFLFVAILSWGRARREMAAHLEPWAPVLSIPWVLQTQAHSPILFNPGQSIRKPWNRFANRNATGVLWKACVHFKSRLQ